MVQTQINPRGGPTDAEPVEPPLAQHPCQILDVFNLSEQKPILHTFFELFFMNSRYPLQKHLKKLLILLIFC